MASSMKGSAGVSTSLLPTTAWNNLTVFIDWNKQQLDGELEEIINPFDLEGKFRAFGFFDVVTVKGDDIAGLLAVVQPVPPADAQPRVVILTALKGRGAYASEQLTNFSPLYA